MIRRALSAEFTRVTPLSCRSSTMDRRTVRARVTRAGTRGAAVVGIDPNATAQYDHQDDDQQHGQHQAYRAVVSALEPVRRLRFGT